MAKPAQKPVELVTEKNQQTNKSKSSAKSDNGRASSGRVLSVLTFFLIIIVAGACGYLWYVEQQHYKQLETRLNELQINIRSLDSHPAIVELKNNTNKQNSALSEKIDNLVKQNEALNKSFIKLNEVNKRDQRGWILAEVEYLLHTAATRLYLVRDTNTATQALITADERLHDLSDPNLLPIRKKLSDEITLLKTITPPDIDGTILKLTQITNRLHLLPAASAIPSTPIKPDRSLSDEPLTSSWWSKIKNALGVSNNNQPRNTLLQREDLYYLDQLLRLEIEAARQALLRLDQEDYERRLQTAMSVLDQHYSRENEHVIRLRNDIRSLQDQALFKPLPDISGSLNLLKKFIARYKTAK